MTQKDEDFERRLTSWLKADAPAEEPAGLLQAVVTRTATTRRRPGWAITARWMPSITLPVVQMRQTYRAAWLLVVLALIAATAAAILVVGSLRRLPPPVGLARAGLIAFDGGGDIAVVDASGSKGRSLTSTQAVETSPNFSPDGTKIAYWSRGAVGLPASLWVMDADGSDPANVTGTTNFSSLENLQAAWSPDSHQLAFVVGDYYASAQLWVVTVDGTDLHKVGEGSLSRSDPAWSPDGRLIAFRGHTIGVLPDAFPADPAIGVYVTAPDGTGERKVSQSAGSGGGPNYRDFLGPRVGTAPSWSPDGRTLLYATGIAGSHALAIATIDGSSERIIDLPAGDHLLPTFSPDGLRIAFQDLAPTEDRATTFVVQADGTGLYPLEGGAPVALNPVFWSPDGQFVVTYALDLSEVHLAASGRSASDAREQPPVSIGMGTSSTTSGFPERASWQRLAP
jgi:Tol biopolymer transport system component